MAFCNSCGATLTPGTKFCNKCGAVATSAPAATPTPVAAPPSTGGSSALKIILIVVGVIVLFGILAVASIGFFAHRMLSKSHVTQEGNHVKVETPFGNVETSNDPSQTARDLNVEIYPGAKVDKNGASTASFGGVHTVSATFQSSDSLDKVCAFYKAKYPNPMVSTSDNNRCTIISNDQKNMITINIEANGDASKIQITNVSKPPTTGSSN